MAKSRELMRLVEGPPARKIGRSASSITGMVWTRFGYEVPYESHLEMKHILVFDFDASVSAIKAQPVAVSYVDPEGVRRTHYPDLLVCFHPKARRRNPPAPWLCEVKYSDDLARKRSELLPKIMAAHRYARENGMRYRILTDKAIDPIFYGNVVFLRRYRHERRNLETEAILERSLSVLGEGTPESVLAASFRIKKRRMEAIYSLWQMVLYGVIETDLSRPLTMASRLKLAE